MIFLHDFSQLGDIYLDKVLEKFLVGELGLAPMSDCHLLLGLRSQDGCELQG